MKISFRYTLAALALVSFSSLQAKVLSNRTFLRARPTTSNNLFLSSAHQQSFHEGKKLGTTISATYLYRTSYNDLDMATYFGGGQEVNNNQSATIEGLLNIADTDEARNDYFDALSVETEPSTETGPADFSTLTTMSPIRSEYGMHVHFEQDLSSWGKGLSVMIDAPIIKTETSMRSVTTDTGDDLEAVRFFHGAIEDLENDTAGYDTAARQHALKYARISDSTWSTANIADLDVTLKYSADRTASTALDLQATLTLPTSPKLDAKEVFGPQVGSDGHTAVGGGMHFIKNLTANQNQYINFHFDANLKYVLQARQKRTLGIYNHAYHRLATSGHYRALVRAYYKGAIPAANVLTRDLLVTPRGQADLRTRLEFVHNDFTLNAFYNLYARAQEHMELAPSSKWVGREYGMYQAPYQTDEPRDFSVTFNQSDPDSYVNIGNPSWTQGGPIQEEFDTTNTTRTSGTALSSSNQVQYYVSRQACTSPSDVTHKTGGSVGYTINNQHSTICLSAGGEYEWSATSRNSGIRSWATWAKLSLSF